MKCIVMADCGFDLLECMSFLGKQLSLKSVANKQNFLSNILILHEYCSLKYRSATFSKKNLSLQILFGHELA